jgi:hypothetical protein
MATIVLIEGTWGGAWARPGAACRTALEKAGHTTILFQGWSGDIDGIPDLFDRGGNSDWEAGGYGLRYFLRAVSGQDVIALAHSHGINPLLYQATLPANGLPPLTIRALVSVCSPSREDMQERAREAMRLGKFGHWRHLYADGWDFMARAGELFDGHFGWRRVWPAASENVPFKGVGHSKLLNDPRYIPALVAQVNEVAARTDHPFFV